MEVARHNGDAGLLGKWRDRAVLPPSDTDRILEVCSSSTSAENQQTSGFEKEFRSFVPANSVIDD